MKLASYAGICAGFKALAIIAALFIRHIDVEGYFMEAGIKYDTGSSA